MRSRKICKLLMSFFLLICALSQPSWAQSQHPLEVIGASYTDPLTSRGHISLRNKSIEMVICTVKIKGIIVGHSGGNEVRARQEADPVEGFIIKPGREANLSFDFSSVVKKMRTIWNDPNAILSEIDESSFTDDCKPFNSTPTASRSYIFSNSWDAVFNDVDGRQEAFRLKLNLPSKFFQSISYAADGRLMAIAGDYHVELFSMPGHQYVKTIMPSMESIRGAYLSPDGRYLITTEHVLSERDHTWIRVLDMQTNQTMALNKFEGNQLFPTNTLMISPDGRHLAITDRTQGLVKILSLPYLELQRTLPVSWPSALTYSRDGQYLAVGSYDNFVAVFRTSDGGLYRQMYEHSWVTDLVFTQNGSQLLVGSGRNERLTARLWNLASGSVARSYLDLSQGGRIAHVSFAPDESKVLLSYFTWNEGGSGNPEQGVIFSFDGQRLGTVVTEGRDYHFTPMLP